MSSTQYGYSAGQAPPKYVGKLGLGAWFYTAQFDLILPAEATQEGNAGTYLLAESLLAAEAGTPDQGLWGFFRVGLANDAVNEIAGYTGAGFSYVGPFRGRANDVLGLGVAVAHNGSAFRERARHNKRPVDAREAAFELTYAMVGASWITLQADVQYVVNPGMDPTVENALLVGLRIVAAR